jgi:phosphoribosyl-ATP pyrophosphohydrolase/phosphoribosyl-AMP cyclohydrolase/histidinol dehydrogenase
VKRLRPEQLTGAIGAALDAGTLAATGAILDEVRQGGDEALRALRARFEGVAADEPLVLEARELARARDALAAPERELLERVAARIARFAAAQRGAIAELDVAIDGGRAGHTLAPVESAGCYAPGGGYPLISSLLMTAVTARAAGVGRVWASSPRPGALMCAAAAIAGADALLACGGAQAVAALAFGTASVPACDVIVGPGNRWVTAAKQLVSGQVGIDMLAGPSELLVLADDSAEPALVAADLLAQAEHASDARVLLLTTHEPLIAAVDEAARRQLAALATREVAAAAWAQAAAVHCRDLDEQVALADRLAPEHLQLHLADAAAVAPRLRHYGALFVGARSAEVFGDYGAGPNHVLPTGGSARFRGGLSVLSFLRVRTWLALDAAPEVARDAEALAELEGLAAHAHAAALRL